jgi:serine O-acetyltransferase
MTSQARAVQGRFSGMAVIAMLRQPVRPPLWCRLLYQDYRRYRAAGQSCLTTLFLTQGFWASLVYRSCHALVDALRFGVLQMPARALAGTLQKSIEVVAGICIPRSCDIGGGLYFPRFGGIILSHGPIGANCTIEQSVTIGAAGKGEEWGRPVIGNRVFIGAHSIIVGKITIGDDAMICPGSFVTRSVPPRAVVMGNPAKVLSYEGSFDSIAYDGMEDDPERLASLRSSGGL